MSEEKPYEFHGYDSKDIMNMFFTGYHRQRKAGSGVIWQVLKDLTEKGEPNYKILLFGMPGTGKSSYPKALMKDFIENDQEDGFIVKLKKNHGDVNCNFSLFQIKCLGLLTRYTDLASLRKVLSLMEKDIARNTPAIVVFDELDAFSPEKRGQAEYLSYWTMNFVKSKFPGLAIFGIVNYPDKIEWAVYREFEHLFYLDLPDENTVTEILKHFKIPSSQEIARKLCVNPVDTGELLNGCKAALKFKADGVPDKLKSMDPEILADFIGEYLKIPWEKVREYGLDNDFFIKIAARHMEFWEERRNLLSNAACC